MQVIKIRVVALFCIFLSVGAMAQISKDDLAQDLKIDSESQSFDIKNGILRFTENVRVTQGSMLVTADELSVEQTDGDGTEVLTAKGKPATYRQTLSDGKLLEAKADFIEYDVVKRTLILKNNAQITQAGSLVQGEEIVYNMESEQLQATSAKSGIVTTILKPKLIKKDEQDK